MQATMHETFIADWQNYLHELGLVISWDTDSKPTLETTMQAGLTQEAIAQEVQIESMLSNNPVHLWNDKQSERHSVDAQQSDAPS